MSRRRRKNRLRKRPSHNPQERRVLQKPEENVDHTRRRLLGLGIGLGSAVAVGEILGIRALFQKKSPERSNALPEDKEVKNRVSLDIPVNSDISVPEYSFPNKPLPFVMPRYLDISDEHFTLLSRALTDKFKLEVERSLIPALKDNPQNKKEVILEFLARIGIIIGNSRPEAKQSMDKFMETFADPLPFVEYINNYINPSGLYVLYTQFNNQDEIEVYTIEDAFWLDIKDKISTESVPIFRLANAMIDTDSDSLKYDEMAIGDPFLNRALIFADKIKPSIQHLLENGPKYPNFNVGNNLNKLLENVYMDLIRHEGTHIFLGRRFPNTARALAAYLKIRSPLKIPLYGDKNNSHFMVDGYFPSIYFHELCGVGSHIAASESAIPYTTFLYLNAHQPPASYELVQRVLSLAILQEAPETPLRRECLNQLIGQNGFVDFNKIYKLIGTQPFSMEHYKKAGEIAYQVGYSAFDSAEKGQLEVKTF